MAAWAPTPAIRYERCNDSRLRPHVRNIASGTVASGVTVACRVPAQVDGPPSLE
jgi:hypothetical protein